MRKSTRSTTALNLLTVVRNQRGVYDELDATMSVEAAMEEIKKEYHKEYLLEGVMFYYYKRTGADMLPNMETPMADAEYVLPSARSSIETLSVNGSLTYPQHLFYQALKSAILPHFR